MSYLLSKQMKNLVFDMNMKDIGGAFFGIIIIISLSILFLKTFWWLCFAGSATIIIYLFVKKRKEAKIKGSKPPIHITTYTQKCPGCGANIEVDEYAEFARCDYCGLSAPAMFMKEKKPPKEHDSSKEIELYLKILAGILIVLGSMGLYLHLTYVPTEYTQNQYYYYNTEK